MLSFYLGFDMQKWTLSLHSVCVLSVFLIFGLSACVQVENQKVTDTWIPIDAKMLVFNCDDPNVPRKFCDEMSVGEIGVGGTSGAMNGGQTNCRDALEACHLPGDEDCDGFSDCEDSDCQNQACDDGNVCTHSDTCVNGVCGGQAISCPNDICVERSCNGTATCTERVREGESCDDGNACSFDDRCQGTTCVPAGSVTCQGDACIDRSCNGTASCSESFKDGAGCDDGNLCTHSDVCGGGACQGQPVVCADNPCQTGMCNGSPSCTMVPKADGSGCGASNKKCCGGSCVNIAANEDHCGGCGIRCGSNYSCYAAPEGSGYCSCGATSECKANGADYTCYNDGNSSRCNCQSDGDCAPGQSCMVIQGHNYCRY